MSTLAFGLEEIQKTGINCLWFKFCCYAS